MEQAQSKYKSVGFVLFVTITVLAPVTVFTARKD